MFIRKVDIVVMSAAMASGVIGLWSENGVVAPCDSPIYCHGDILKEIEMAQPFADSKTFVDMPALSSLETIQSAFANLSHPLTNNSALHDFLSTHFGPAGAELTTLPTPLTTNATFLSTISDPTLRNFTSSVVDIWPNLTRQYHDGSNSSLPTSFLPVKRPFVIAGGRFREPYYWDTYWIVEGLLRSGEHFVELAKNAIENFLDFIEIYGFVPNGARVYYLNRSQPPVLALITQAYIAHTNDTSILPRAIPLLEAEYAFWMTNRSVYITTNKGNNVTLNIFNVLNTQPRPESYWEDTQTASLLNVSDTMSLYANLASGAESGWDYTGGRWLANPEDAMLNITAPLRSLNVINTVPVDLNSILYGVEKALSSFHGLVGNSSAKKIWKEKAKTRAQAINEVFWNEDFFSYFDYNLTSLSQNIFVPLDSTDTANSTASAFFRQNAPIGHKRLHTISSYFPLWTGAAPASLRKNPVALLKMYAPVRKLLDTYSGGISATNLATGQQWDFPNVWPPHMYILMASLSPAPPCQGLAPATASAAVQRLALELAQRYVSSAYCTGKTTRAENGGAGVMFEKYSAEKLDGVGGGGEYKVVEGFGWTNGVLIWAVERFGWGLKAPECVEGEKQYVKRARRAAVEVDGWDAKWIARG